MGCGILSGGAFHARISWGVLEEGRWCGRSSAVTTAVKRWAVLLFLRAVENMLDVWEEKVCIPCASVSAVDLGVELHANLRHLPG